MGEWESGWNMIGHILIIVGDGWWINGSSLHFFSMFWICFIISTMKFHAFVSWKSSYSLKLNIRSRMNSSPLDLTLLFPILLWKGIICWGAREVTAGVFAVRLHWASSDDIDPCICGLTCRSRHGIIVTCTDSAARLSGFDPCLCHLPAVYPWQAT